VDFELPKDEWGRLRVRFAFSPHRFANRGTIRAEDRGALLTVFAVEPWDAARRDACLWEEFPNSSCEKH
jgi:hypothetical protein